MKIINKIIKKSKDRREAPIKKALSAIFKKLKECGSEIIFIFEPGGDMSSKSEE